MNTPLKLGLLILSFLLSGNLFAHGKAVTSDKNKAITASFDILESRITRDGPDLVFQHVVKGGAGHMQPNSIGKLAGSEVFAYVWPTSLNSSAAGFESDQGILAFVLTSHPDFDDTPKYDENRDNIYDNDGGLWHSHWVVLTKDNACGEGALKVVDIPKDAKPKLPTTWPGLPLLIDSPGYEPTLKKKLVSVRVPLKDIGFPESFNYDGVTAALKVNENIHSPLLCVTQVFDVSSGDLSLPGLIKP